jgi:gliding motility-associated-like protein
MRKLIYIFICLFGIFSAESASAAPPACPTISVTGANASCYNLSDGSATVVVLTGGSGSYTHTWSDGTVTSGGSSTINFLSSGTYTVTVKDNNSGCSVVGAYVVSEPDPISISESITHVNCFGDATGIINVNVLGGISPYSYSWTNSSGTVVATTEDLTNFAAGTYTLVVNAPTSSCSFTKTFTILQSTEALNSSVLVTNVNCFGNTNGEIDVSVWGGTAPYAYSWDSGQNSQDISGLGAGNYTLTITDNKGCTRQETYNIGQPNVLSGTMSKVDVLCHGNTTGIVEINPSGGVAPYTYAWQNSQNVLVANTSTLTNVKAETYQVTVTDANGCTFISSEVINQPSKLTLGAAVTDVNCNGGSDGAIDLTVSGGIAPYTYVWTNSVPNTVGVSQDISGIIAGTYSVVVTDNNGCIANTTETVTQPLSPILVNVEVTPVLCNGENTGAINLTVSGGTPSYTYSWASGQITEDINNILSGTYQYTVIDNNGCTSTGNVLVTQPSQPLSVTNIITDVNCFGEANGSIDLTVNGGTPGYTYEWTSSAFQLSNTNQDLINYIADDYRYKITDDNGCTIIDTLTITEPTLLNSTVVGTNILCKGETTGAIDLSVVGGVFPYTYAWNDGSIIEDLVNLPAGNFSVVVTDNNGCTTSNSIELTEPQDTLFYSFTVKDVTCNDGTDGEIVLSVEGGTNPYTYDWSTGDTSSTIQNLVAGVYGFLVTDNNGCTVTDTATIEQPDPITLNEVITDVSCYGFKDGAIDVTPTGGTAPYDFTWFNTDFGLSAQTEDLINFPAEVYQLEIVDTNGCMYEMFLEIEQPDSIIIEYTFSIVSCNDGSDASIDVEVTGGTPAYIYDWSNGATTQDLINIPAGVYNLNLEDQNGCKDSVKVEITQPEPIAMSFETTNITCKDQTDGTAYATAIGGNGGYTFYWDNGTIDAYTDNLPSDWHSVQVVDILGCDLTDSAFVDINPIACIDPVNTFTPNEDNYNETWMIDNMYLYPEFNMQIFNKWGNLVHNIDKEFTPWEGTYLGEALPSGVYYWIIKLNNKDNEVLKGNITIIR